MSFQAKDSTVTFKWSIAPNASPPVKADFDINLVLPNGTATYVDDGITTYVAPTATLQGEATYNLVLAVTGLYQVTLSTGTAAVHILSAHREIYSVIPPASVITGRAPCLTQRPAVIPPAEPILSGIIWTERANPDNIDLNGIYYDGSGRWCVIGENQGGGDTYILTSDDDGVTWDEQVNTGLNQTYNDLVFAEGVWVAPGNASGVQTSILTSPDAETWTDRDTPDNNAKQQAITHAIGIFVTVGHVFSGNNYTLWSENGTTGWTIGDTTGITNASMFDIAFGAGVFCAIGDEGAMSSVDGKTWTDRTADLPSQTEVMRGLIFDGTQFVACGEGKVWTSPDGTTTWTELVTTGDFTGAGDEGFDISFNPAGGGVYVICGKDNVGVGAVWRSTDLLQWDRQTTDGDLNELRSIHFDNALWVIAGNNQFDGVNDAALLTAP